MRLSDQGPTNRLTAQCNWNQVRSISNQFSSTENLTNLDSRQSVRSADSATSRWSPPFFSTTCDYWQQQTVPDSCR